MNEKIEAIIKKINCSNEDAQRIRCAYETAERSHMGQLRSSGEPYIIHPLAVAEILTDYTSDADTIIGGLLHDCIEDTDTGYEQIKSAFGVRVADLVEGVTKLTRMPYVTPEEEESENIRKMFLAMAKDIHVIIIKLCDRLHNMRTLMYRPEQKQRIKAFESMQIYAPIAHRLGMNAIKDELEDLSIMYLDPVGYKYIIDYLHRNEAERQSLLNSIIERLKAHLHEHGIEACVEGRVKHIYGIYNKVYMHNRDIEQVYDIYAVRVITDTIPQCYNVLGLVHELYHPMPGRFKDYIYTPKPNMYQSLHTTVIGRDGMPVEVQIRTWDMHNTAEYGIAAHWKYKDNIHTNSQDEMFAWVRRFLESQQENDDREEFISDLRIELFADEVFVFTPKGDIVNLPMGSTAIDFAYAIHSAIGNRMIGARVNGKMIPLDRPLQNGDIIEVVTSNASRGPSRDWLKVAKTGEARNKIKQWYKKEKREENVQRGREEFESELRRNLLTHMFDDEQRQAQVLKRYKFDSMEDMYAAFGYGGLSVRKVINHLVEEHNRLERAQRSQPRAVKETKPTSGVIVEGIDNCLIKFAHCCTPIPGDHILGYVTKGAGVSIHRADCTNIIGLLKNPENSERVIKVRWATRTEEYYSAAIQITGVNRIGILADITRLISEMNISLTNMKANDIASNVVVDVTVNLHHAEQLGQLVIKLKKIEGVDEVTRIIR